MRRKVRTRGGATMEFALWLPILAILVGGVTDLGWYLSRYQDIARAARDGARVGSTVLEDQTASRGSQIEAAATTQALQVLDDLGLTCGQTDRCTVTARYDDSTGHPAIVVTVTYPFEPLVGMFPMPHTLAAQFTMMTQQSW